MENSEEASMVGDLAYQFLLLDREIEKLKQENDDLREQMASVGNRMKVKKTNSNE